MSLPSPLPPPSPSPQPETPAWLDRQQQGLSRAQWLGLGGGAAVIIGSLMPWVTATTAFGTINIAGTSGDGRFTLLLGALIIVGFVIGKGAWLRWAASLISMLVAAYYVWFNDLTSGSEYVRTSIGWGLYLTLAGAILAVVSCSELRPSRRARRSLPAI